MVFYFTCQSRPDLAEKYIIYMGRDKHENEMLIKWVAFYSKPLIELKF